MEWMQLFIPLGIAIVGAIIHVEVNMAIMKTDIKWIKNTLIKPKE